MSESHAIVTSDSSISDQASMISCRPSRVAIISFTLAKVNPIICYNGQIFKHFPKEASFMVENQKFKKINNLLKIKMKDFHVGHKKVVHKIL